MSEFQIPETAHLRMHQAEEGGNWSSDLSAAELTAVRHAGFEPVDLVLGSSIYHVGAQWNSGWSGWRNTYPCTYGSWGSDHRTGYNWEHTVYQTGVDEAYRLALGRLIEETREAKAHGVVGVRVNMRNMEHVGGMIEFTAIGTAIKRRGAPLLDEPFTSHLSGVEFAKLMQTGYVPTRLVFTVSAVQINEGCVVEHQAQSFANQEINQISDAVRWVRHNVINQLAEISAPYGKHTIGVKTRVKTHEVGMRSRLIHMDALGTVVHEFANVPLPKEPLPILRLT